MLDIYLRLIKGKSRALNFFLFCLFCALTGLVIGLIVVN